VDPGSHAVRRGRQVRDDKRKKMLNPLLHQSNLTIPDEKISLLEKFINLFVEKNQHINLTKINDEEEFIIKHIIDSLLIGQIIDIKPNTQIADLGTGGGLPGIPLAILNPKCRFTLIDSVQKKIKCVDEFTSNLDINNVIGLSDRLETIGQNKKYREQFDTVIARALAPLPILLELALPLVRIGGIFVAMKGPSYLEELSRSVNAMKQIKIERPTIKTYELPDGMGKRYLLVFKKANPTPKGYPRNVGVPKKQPL